MGTLAEGSFTIDSWDETTVDERDDGTRLNKASIVQNYSGDIDGSSKVEYLMLHAADKSARFLGFETVQASIGGKQGSFVLQHDGKFSIGVASSTFKVVSGSGRGGLMNISGSGSFTSTGEGASDYKFEYNADSSEDQVGTA
ncbi:MAG: DUF3224 domain-containing protein [Pseudomonadales bacterium]